MKSDWFPRQSYRTLCASGDSNLVAVPSNMIGHVTDLEIDSHNQSGLTSSITVQLVDSYTPTGGSATRAILKDISVVPGSFLSLDTKEVPEVIGTLIANVNYANSGPAISVGVIFE